MSVAVGHNRIMSDITNEHSAFIVVESAEGRRSSLHRTVSSDTLTQQREALAHAGIGKIRTGFGGTTRFR